MKNSSELRWNRLIKIGLDIGYLKKFSKKNFNIRIKEDTIEEFTKNIKNYTKIDEFKFLNILEETTYKRCDIFYIKQYKKYQETPICSDLSNQVFRESFKNKNNINMKNGEYFDGTLGEVYTVTYFFYTEDYASINLGRIIEKERESLDEESFVVKETYEEYDVVKFLIDINEERIIMFHNDIEGEQGNNLKTLRKASFRELFTNTTQTTLIRSSLIRELKDYFIEYVNDMEAGVEEKYISLIQSKLENGKSSLRSFNKDCEHDTEEIMALKKKVLERNHYIYELIILIDEDEININSEGQLNCINNFFDKEVIDNVCKETLCGYSFSGYI